jgi:hypothetical protein
VRIEIQNVPEPGSEPELVAAAMGTVSVKYAPQKSAT